VKAVMTTRHGGTSAPPFDSFNLGDHVRDEPHCVQANRRHLAAALGAQTVFLQQVHGAHCVTLGPATPHGTPADACVTHQSRLACTVMVADCLPVLVCDSAGQTVGAAHAGWRGLAGVGDAAAGGVLALFVKHFCALALDGIEKNAIVSSATESPVATAMAWLGPCIGPKAFEVGPEVRAAFLDTSPHFAATAACFEAVWGKPGFHRCDLAALARLQLAALGISRLYGNDSSPAWCTVGQPSVWFSHRRDAVPLGGTGRMAACIWLD
jgi:copper oxidase (laccase) domain-containing protein